MSRVLFSKGNRLANPQSMAVSGSGSPNRWDQGYIWYIITQSAVYTTYKFINIFKYHLYIANWVIICYRSHLFSGNQVQQPLVTQGSYMWIWIFMATLVSSTFVVNEDLTYLNRRKPNFNGHFVYSMDICVVILKFFNEVICGWYTMSLLCCEEREVVVLCKSYLYYRAPWYGASNGLFALQLVPGLQDGYWGCEEWILCEAWRPVGVRKAVHIQLRDAGNWPLGVRLQLSAWLWHQQKHDPYHPMYGIFTYIYFFFVW